MSSFYRCGIEVATVGKARLLLVRLQARSEVVCPSTLLRCDWQALLKVNPIGI